MMSVKIEGEEQVVQGLKRALDSIPTTLRSQMEECAGEVEQIMKGNTKVQTGSLSDSISHEVKFTNTETIAHIGPSDSHFAGRPVGRATELGRNPGGGFPNWFEISNRYGVSTAVGYAIAKAIVERGTRPGLRYVEKTLSQTVRIFAEYGMNASRVIAQKF